MKQFITFTFALLVLFGLTVGAKAQDAYGIEINGKTVTNDNASNIWTGTTGGESGTISFDTDTRVLTLDNVQMHCTGHTQSIYIRQGAPEVTIQLKGDNRITHELGRITLEGKKVTITGLGGSLQTISKGVALYIDEGCQLFVQGGCTVDVAGDYGINSLGYGQRSTLTIDGNEGTVLKAKGDHMPSISGLGNITLRNCVIIDPAGAKVDGGYVAVNGAPTSQQVVIKQVPKDYDIKVNGITVTPDNASDILGDQTVSYKKKYAMLTLSNSTIEAKGVPAIEANTTVYINLKGENKISSDGEVAIRLGSEAILYGSGSIEGEAPIGTAIQSEGDLTIKGINCSASGLKALHGATPQAKLRVEDAQLTLEGSEGALYGFADISLVKDFISSPQGAVLQDGAVMRDGVIYKGRVVIERPIDLPLFVAGSYVSTANSHDILGDGTISFDNEKKVLKLNNFKYTTKEMNMGINVMQAMGDITIELHGDNEIVTPYMGLVFTSGGNIVGDGTLSIKANSQGLVLNGSSVTIEKGPTLLISGKDSGIFGFQEEGGTLFLDGAHVIVEKGGIVNLSELLFNGCGISTPEGAELIKDYNAKLGRNFISVGLNGEIYRDKIIIDVTKGLEETLVPSNCQIRVAEGVLYVCSDTSQTLSLLDLDGRVRHVTEAVAGEECRIEGLSSGSYLLRLGLQTYKVIIP